MKERKFDDLLSIALYSTRALVDRLKPQGLRAHYFTQKSLQTINMRLAKLMRLSVLISAMTLRVSFQKLILLVSPGFSKRSEGHKLWGTIISWFHNSTIPHYVKRAYLVYAALPELLSDRFETLQILRTTPFTVFD